MNFEYIDASIEESEGRMSDLDADLQNISDIQDNPTAFERFFKLIGLEVQEG